MEDLAAKTADAVHPLPAAEANRHRASIFDRLIFQIVNVVNFKAYQAFILHNFYIVVTKYYKCWSCAEFSAILIIVKVINNHNNIIMQEDKNEIKLHNY